jgi:hypothetical protein
MLGKKRRLQQMPTAASEQSPMGNDIDSYEGGLAMLIARTYAVNVISDAYWNPSLIKRIIPYSSEPSALFRTLDQLVGSSHRWDRRGDLIRLRSQTWSMDRQREVPLRMVRKWMAYHHQYGAMPLQAYLDDVAALNNGQMDLLPSLVRQLKLPSELNTIPPHRYLIRLYAALTPTQRQLLWQGRRISAAELTPDQTKSAVAALTQQLRNRFPGLSLDATTISDPIISLTKQQVTQPGQSDVQTTTDRPRLLVTLVIESALGIKDELAITVVADR